jgi:hypothetical protein
MSEVKVFVNLEKGVATIQVLKRLELFEGPKNRFVIEADLRGFSAIERRADGLYEINVLDGEIIEERKLEPEEAKALIRKIIRAREIAPEEEA